MSSLKFEIGSLPQLIEREGRLWFKLRHTDKRGWQPDVWREPPDDLVLQSFLNDNPELSRNGRTWHVGAVHVERLMGLSGMDQKACDHALRCRKWSPYDKKYLSISVADFETQLNEPIRSGNVFWFYRNRLVKVIGEAIAEELPLLVKHSVLRHEKSLYRVTP